MRVQIPPPKASSATTSPRMGLTSIDKITLTMTPPTITDTGNSQGDIAPPRGMLGGCETIASG
jgi:hypothetical protein